MRTTSGVANTIVHELKKVENSKGYLTKLEDLLNIIIENDIDVPTLLQ